MAPEAKTPLPCQHMLKCPGFCALQGPCSRERARSLCVELEGTGLRVGSA